ncbi:HAD-IA family hydrolase [Streptomyces sp. NPDC002172]
MTSASVGRSLDVLAVAVDELRAGRPVVVVDDEDRENEGDLVMAAEFATTQAMGFFVRWTSGLICTPMAAEIADRLELPLMVTPAPGTGIIDTTAYTVSVDALGTGSISAADRALTARTLADPTTRPDQLVRPGHVFPLRARPAGIAERRGHTEATVDLPVGVATASPRRFVTAVLDSLGLLEHLDVVVCGEDVVRAKPAPDAYLRAAAGLRFAPSDCLAVEDSPHGIRSAAAAGMRVLAIPRHGMRLPADVASLPAAHARTATDALPLLSRFLTPRPAPAGNRSPVL